MSIPDLTSLNAGQDHWLGSFILNSSFVFTADDASRRTFFNFIRKAQAALRAHEAARQATMTYLEKASAQPNFVSGYFLALDHWETFLSLAYQAWTVMVRGQAILFNKEDGSLLQRLNLLYNLTKHIDSAIRGRAGQPQFPAEGTVPVWLENDGLHSTDAVLTFTEITEMMEELARWADAAQNLPTMRDTIMGAYPSTDGEDSALAGTA